MRGYPLHVGKCGWVDAPGAVGVAGRRVGGKGGGEEVEEERGTTWVGWTEMGIGKGGGVGGLGKGEERR